VVPRRGEEPRFDFLLGPVSELTDSRVMAFRGELERTARAVTRLSMRNPRDRGGRRCRPPQATDTHDSLKVVTLNVNSVRDKRAELKYFVDKVHPDVLLLQETHLRDTDWSLRLPGYRVADTCATEERGHFGLAIAVSAKFPMEVVGQMAGTHCFVRIFGGGLPSPFIFGSVYCPQGRQRDTVRQLAAQIRSLTRRFPGTGMWVGGDWNRPANYVIRRLARAGVLATLVRFDGSPMSRPPHAGRGGAIDYFLAINSPAGHTKERVYRKWALSDHWPVGLEVRNIVHSQLTDTPTFKVINRRVLTDKRADIATDNYWLPLANVQPEETEPEDITASFVKAAIDVLDKHGVREDWSKGQPPRMPYELRRQFKRLNKHRADLHEARAQDAPSGQIVDLRRQWEAYRQRTRSKVRTYQTTKWYASVKRCTDSRRKGRPVEVWRWVNTILGRQRAAANGVTPIRDKTGAILTAVDQIRERWAEHYGDLAHDARGHSKDPEHWPQFPLQLKQVADGTAINTDITWQEVILAAQWAKSNKASGPDGIPMELYKAIIEHELSQDSISEPSTVMGKALFNVIRTQWQQATTPEIWSTSTIVSIPKKGDLTDCGNSRGISLMDTGLKLLCRIVAKRLSKLFDRGGVLRQEQAGFREREETMAHVCSLYEVCRRRQIQRKRTYLAFIDLRKAYDLVPHEALFYKLEQSGVNGHFLDWLRDLYSVSKLQVRCGSTPSSRVTYGRGLRQGCPLSAVLFDVFINDALDECAGAQVPGVPDQRLPGLLFADDLALVAGSREALAASLKAFEAWCDRWEMELGHAKCGIMGIGRAQERVRHWEWPTLQGQSLPIVDEYLYLGCLFHHSLDLKHTVSYRAERGKKVLAMITPLLRYGSVPIALKLHVVAATLLPTMLYGAELYGMKKTQILPLQRIHNCALRMCAGGKASSTYMPLVPLRLETQSPSIHALASARRCRALAKFPTLSSWIRVLMAHPLGGRTSTWLSGGLRWRKRFVQKQAAQSPESAAAWYQECIQQVTNREVGLAVDSGPLAAYEYVSYGLHETASWVRKVDYDPAASWGAISLLRLRMGCYWTSRKLARCQLLPQRFLHECPMCGEAEPETVPHIILRCAAWETVRQRVFNIPAPLADEDDSDTAALALGRTHGAAPIPQWHSVLRRGDQGEGVVQTTTGLVDLIKAISFIHARRCSYLRQVAPQGRSPHGYGGSYTDQRHSRRRAERVLDLPDGEG
jgi:exonuclease III